MGLAESRPQSSVLIRKFERTPYGMRRTPGASELSRMYEGLRFVGQNHADVVYPTPGKNSAIATSGLWSCTATLVEFVSPAQKGAILAHYDSPTTNRNGFDEEFLKLVDAIDAPFSARALIVTKGKKSQNSPTGYAPDVHVASKLTAHLKGLLGEDTEVVSVGYSIEQNRGYFGGTVVAAYPETEGIRRKILVGDVDISDIF